MEALANLILSVVATAIIAGFVTVIGNESFNQHYHYFVMWGLCFCAWWGIFFMVSEC